MFESASFDHRLPFLALILLCLAPVSFCQTPYNWLQFGGSSAKDNFNRSETILTTSNVSGLQQIFDVSLPSMGDGTPAVVTGVNTVAGMHDVLFFQTEHSHVLALDAHTGTQIWRVNLPTGCFKYTNSAVAVDPGLQYVYATGIDCKIHKLSVYDGSEVTTGGWPATAATSTGQKVSSELAIATDSVSGASYLYETIAYAGATACGCITGTNLATGAQTTWQFDSGGDHVWNRAGASYNSENNEIYISTADEATFDPAADEWDMTVAALNVNLTSKNTGGYPNDSWTPTNWSSLNSADDDLSASVLILPTIPGATLPHLALQTGKSATVWLLNLDNLSGQGGPGHTGGEVTSMTLPTGVGQGVIAQPAAWVNPADGSVWAFIGADTGITAIKLTANGSGVVSMATQWDKTSVVGVTTPHVANGVVYYINDGLQRGGTPTVYAADAVTGTVLWSAGGLDSHHWSSPVVVNGTLYIADGQGADQGSGDTGTIKAYALPVPPPNPPTNLTATAVSSSGINLSWTASTTSGVTYSVFRSTTSGFTASSSNQITSGLTTTSYSDSGLVQSTTYYYLAEAVLSGVASSPSNQASATTQSCPTCPITYAFTGLTIAASSGQSESTFADANCDGGNCVFYDSTATGNYISFDVDIPASGTYDVQVSYKTINTRGIMQTAAASSVGGTYTNVGPRVDQYSAAAGYPNTDLGNFTFSSAGTWVLRFTVTGKDAASSSYTLSFSALTLTPTSSAPPNPPTNLAATGASPSQINLTWTASTTSGVTYSVFRSTTSGFTPSSGNQITSGLTTTSYSDTGLTASTTYYYVAEAVDSGGVSTPSNQASATTGTSTEYAFTSLTIAASSGQSESEFADANCDGGECVFYDSTATGNYISFDVPIPAAGTYDIQVSYKTINTRGIMQTAIASSVGGTYTNVGPTVDEYTASGTTGTYPTTDLGNYTFSSSGTWVFRFTVTGKDSGSSGYTLSFSALTLNSQ